MVPARFRVADRAPETARHLDARARAASTRGAARLRARAVHDALRVRRGRGADLDQRRPDRPGPLVHTVRAVGAATEAICAARARRRARRPRARSAAPGRSTRPRASDVVIVAGGIGLAPLRPVVYERARAPRALRPGRCSSTAAARPTELLYAGELERWRERGDVEVDVTVDSAPADWRGQRRAWCPTLIAARRLRSRARRRDGLRARGDDALRRRARCSERGVRGRAHPRLAGAQHEVRDRPLRPLPARARRSSARTGRCSATSAIEPLLADAGAVMARAKPKLAVWKFASCDGCQLSAARLRGRAARARRRDRDRLLPRGARARRSRAPTTSRWSRARSPRRTTPSASSEVRRAVAARWSRSAPAPPRAASRRCATSPTSRTSSSVVYATPEYISTLATSTPIARPRARSTSSCSGCPIDKRQLLEVISAFLNERKPRDRRRTASASSASARGNVCVMVAHGTPCLGPGHARRLRRALPGLRPRLLRLLRPDGDAEHRRRSARGWTRLGATTVDLVRVYRTFNAERRAVPRRERGAMSAETTRTIRTDVPRARRGRGRDARAHPRRRRSRTCELRIYEPPRFFEAFLRGRALHRGARHHRAHLRHLPGRLPDERRARRWRTRCGVEVDEPLRDLRRLLYCGEWIESHALHVFMLHAPDFLGYESAIEMAQRPPRRSSSGRSQLKKAGNELIARRRRARDPPDQRARRRLLPRAHAARAARRCASSCERAREFALRGGRAGPAALDFPDFERDYEFVALRDPDDYPIERGRLVSNRGLDIAPARVRGALRRGARRALDRAALAPARARRATSSARWPATPQLRPALAARARGGRATPASAPICRNPFRSIVVRAVEILYALDEALRLIDAYEPPDRAGGRVEPRAGVGLRLDRGAARHALPPLRARRRRARSSSAKIVPPTSQNQASIEEDLRGVRRARCSSSDDDELRLRCEQAIRNYDPCISCATHFLRLEVEHA